MARKLQIVVAGGGVAGLAAAAALGRAGHAVTVLEQAPALTEVGAGLQLSPNAMRALDAMGAGEGARALGSRPEAVELRTHASGRTVYRLALGRTAESRWGAPYLNIHRADLLSVLEQAARDAGAEIRLGVKVERAGDIRGGAALYTDSGVFQGDLAIAADGVRSALRPTVGGASRPTFAGNMAWRGAVSAERLPAALLSPRVTVWMGPRRHLVTYPLREGRLLNFVAVQEQAEWTAEGWSTPGDPAELRAAFAGWHPEVATLFEAVQDTFRWGLFGHPTLKRWSRERVAMLGDAAHPTLPFLAQGAAMALEDAVVLTRALAAYDPAQALELWERARKPRATRLQAAAARNGKRFHARFALDQWVKTTALGTFARLAPETAQGLNDWVYSYDPTRAPV